MVNFFSELPNLWFCIIAVLWLGYLFLEGFDFGVGILLGRLAKNDTERRVMINTIGPVWDGNEVWVLVAIGATFAAFPAWYATVLSTAYLPVLLILLALIGRGVAFEYRGKVASQRWRACWDVVIQLGSWIPPLGWGLILASSLTGLPIDGKGILSGGPLALISVPGVLGALALVGFSVVHGAVFLTLKSDGDIQQRARRFVLRYGAFCLAPLVALGALVQLHQGQVWTLIVAIVALVAAAAALLRIAVGREGQAFMLLGLVMVGTIVLLFGSAYPNVIPSTLDPQYSLTVHNAASSTYPLQVMSWVALIGTPAVLVYQGWTYWVFRKRIGVKHIPESHTP